ncbi:unnamed protein product, partial [Hymenolepis diminuta]
AVGAQLFSENLNKYLYDNAIFILTKLSNNYGISDPDCVEAVRKVFDELDIPAIFSAYEDRTRVRILEMIDSMCTEETKDDVDFTSPDATKLPKKFFVELLNLFYRRKK